MTPPETGFDVRRIVVAIDSSSHAAAALEAAATLASQLHAELEGIFVQDINLTRLADLPVGREIQFLTGRGRDFTTEALSAQNREQEGTARRALAAAARRARIGHAFRVVRGQVEVEVISAADNADLLILGMGSRSPGGRARLGQTARAATERAPRSVLISKPGMRSISSPLVCYDGSEGTKRALDAAIKITGTPESNLTALIVAADVDQVGDLRQEVEERLAGFQIHPKFLHCPHPAPDQICRFAMQSGADILVISLESDLIAGQERLTILETVACPVLLVR
ncbi:MAG: universal stress protein [Rhodospirillaceae bacterium]|jgi:nucleotide-binding universal stress UspA family protein|nr:universal stress protein [Rhodospirillaceae bacterium]MBT5459753.1 universal stress protein [Rhodospirillaceae bacterium]